jgi:nucleoid-associated protein YgaU
MPLATRLTLVSLVLLIGIGAAMLFRKQSPESATTSQSTPDALLMRKSPTAAISLSTSRATVVRAAEHPVSNSPPEVSVVRRKPATDRGVRALVPPDLESRYMRPLMPLHQRDKPSAPAKTQAVERFPEPTSSGDTSADENRPKGPRIRIVVDGDSLRSLARRYLGSSDRFMEIYAANRDILSSPELLQIGMQLKIPPNQPAAVQPTETKSPVAKGPVAKGMVRIKN